MPKFSQKEKEIIQNKLSSEGERLFTLYGLKKVTVDELVRAAGISKGSFYAFYTNKEHLYMDIAGRLQAEMWKEMDAFLVAHRSLDPLSLVKQCFLWIFQQIQHYPMLKQADGEVAEYLYRKLPPEVIAAHTREDSQELMKLKEYGITFTCDLELATKVLQTLAISFLNLQQEDADSQSAVMNMMLDGVLKEMIGDAYD